MNSLLIEGSDICPRIELNPKENIFKIQGRSIPEDGKTFYDPVIAWLELYCKDPNKSTHFVFNLEYFNISTSKMLLFILYKLNEVKHAGKEVKVTWYYGDEDDDMQEVGEDYAFMVNIPFEFLQDESRKRNGNKVSS